MTTDSTKLSVSISNPASNPASKLAPKPTLESDSKSEYSDQVSVSGPEDGPQDSYSQHTSNPAQKPNAQSTHTLISNPQTTQQINGLPPLEQLMHIIGLVTDTRQAMRAQNGQLIGAARKIIKEHREDLNTNINDVVEEDEFNNNGSGGLVRDSYNRLINIINNGDLSTEQIIDGLREEQKSEIGQKLRERSIRNVSKFLKDNQQNLRSKLTEEEKTILEEIEDDTKALEKLKNNPDEYSEEQEKEYKLKIRNNIEALKERLVSRGVDKNVVEDLDRELRRRLGEEVEEPKPEPDKPSPTQKTPNAAVLGRGGNGVSKEEKTTDLGYVGELTLYGGFLGASILMSAIAPIFTVLILAIDTYALLNLPRSEFNSKSNITNETQNKNPSQDPSLNPDPNDEKKKDEKEKEEDKNKGKGDGKGEGDGKGKEGKVVPINNNPPKPDNPGGNPGGDNPPKPDNKPGNPGGNPGGNPYGNPGGSPYGAQTYPPAQPNPQSAQHFIPIYPVDSINPTSGLGGAQQNSYNYSQTPGQNYIPIIPNANQKGSGSHPNGYNTGLNVTGDNASNFNNYYDNRNYTFNGGYLGQSNGEVPPLNPQDSYNDYTKYLKDVMDELKKIQKENSLIKNYFASVFDSRKNPNINNPQDRSYSYPNPDRGLDPRPYQDPYYNQYPGRESDFYRPYHVYTARNDELYSFMRDMQKQIRELNEDRIKLIKRNTELENQDRQGFNDKERNDKGLGDDKKPDGKGPANDENPDGKRPGGKGLGDDEKPDKPINRNLNGGRNNAGAQTLRPFSINTDKVFSQSADPNHNGDNPHDEEVDGGYSQDPWYENHYNKLLEDNERLRLQISLLERNLAALGSNINKGTNPAFRLEDHPKDQPEDQQEQQESQSEDQPEGQDNINNNYYYNNSSFYADSPNDIDYLIQENKRLQERYDYLNDEFREAADTAKDALKGHQIIVHDNNNPIKFFADFVNKNDSNEKRQNSLKSIDKKIDEINRILDLKIKIVNKTRVINEGESESENLPEEEQEFENQAEGDQLEPKDLFEEEEQELESQAGGDQSEPKDSNNPEVKKEEEILNTSLREIMNNLGDSESEIIKKIHNIKNVAAVGLYADENDDINIDVISNKNELKDRPRHNNSRNLRSIKKLLDNLDEQRDNVNRSNQDLNKTKQKLKELLQKLSNKQNINLKFRDESIVNEINNDKKDRVRSLLIQKNGTAPRVLIESEISDDELSELEKALNEYYEKLENFKKLKKKLEKRVDKSLERLKRININNSLSDKKLFSFKLFKAIKKVFTSKSEATLGEEEQKVKAKLNIIRENKNNIDNTGINSSRSTSTEVSLGDLGSKPTETLNLGVSSSELESEHTGIPVPKSTGTTVKISLKTNEIKKKTEGGDGESNIELNENSFLYSDNNGSSAGDSDVTFNDYEIFVSLSGNAYRPGDPKKPDSGSLNDTLVGKGSDSSDSVSFNISKEQNAETPSINLSANMAQLFKDIKVTEPFYSRRYNNPGKFEIGFEKIKDRMQFVIRQLKGNGKEEKLLNLKEALIEAGCTENQINIIANELEKEETSISEANELEKKETSISEITNKNIRSFAEKMFKSNSIRSIYIPGAPIKDKNTLNQQLSIFKTQPFALFNFDGKFKDYVINELQKMKVNLVINRVSDTSYLVCKKNHDFFKKNVLNLKGSNDENLGTLIGIKNGQVIIDNSLRALKENRKKERQAAFKAYESFIEKTPVVLKRELKNRNDKESKTKFKEFTIADNIKSLFNNQINKGEINEALNYNDFNARAEDGNKAFINLSVDKYDAELYFQDLPSTYDNKKFNEAFLEFNNIANTIIKFNKENIKIGKDKTKQKSNGTAEGKLEDIITTGVTTEDGLSLFIRNNDLVVGENVTEEDKKSNLLSEIFEQAKYETKTGASTKVAINQNFTDVKDEEIGKALIESAGHILLHRKQIKIDEKGFSFNNAKEVARHLKNYDFKSVPVEIIEFESSSDEDSREERQFDDTLKNEIRFKAKGNLIISKLKDGKWLVVDKNNEFFNHGYLNILDEKGKPTGNVFVKNKRGEVELNSKAAEFRDARVEKKISQINRFTNITNKISLVAQNEDKTSTLYENFGEVINKESKKFTKTINGKDLENINYNEGSGSITLENDLKDENNNPYTKIEIGISAVNREPNVVNKIIVEDDPVRKFRGYKKKIERLQDILKRNIEINAKRHNKNRTIKTSLDEIFNSRDFIGNNDIKIGVDKDANIVILENPGEKIYKNGLYESLEEKQTSSRASTSFSSSKPPIETKHSHTKAKDDTNTQTTLNSLINLKNIDNKEINSRINKESGKGKRLLNIDIAKDKNKINNKENLEKHLRKIFEDKGTCGTVIDFSEYRDGDNDLNALTEQMAKEKGEDISLFKIGGKRVVIKNNFLDKYNVKLTAGIDTNKKAINTGIVIFKDGDNNVKIDTDLYTERQKMIINAENIIGSILDKMKSSKVTVKNLKPFFDRENKQVEFKNVILADKIDDLFVKQEKTIKTNDTKTSYNKVTVSGRDETNKEGKVIKQTANIDLYGSAIVNRETIDNYINLNSNLESIINKKKLKFTTTNVDLTNEVTGSLSDILDNGFVEEGNNSIVAEKDEKGNIAFKLIKGVRDGFLGIFNKKENEKIVEETVDGLKLRGKAITLKQAVLHTNEVYNGIIEEKMRNAGFFIKSNDGKKDDRSTSRNSRSTSRNSRSSRDYKEVIRGPDISEHICVGKDADIIENVNNMKNDYIVLKKNHDTNVNFDILTNSFNKEVSFITVGDNYIIFKKPNNIERQYIQIMNENNNTGIILEKKKDGTIRLSNKTIEILNERKTAVNKLNEELEKFKNKILKANIRVENNSTDTKSVITLKDDKKKDLTIGGIFDIKKEIPIADEDIKKVNYEEGTIAAKDDYSKNKRTKLGRIAVIKMKTDKFNCYKDKLNKSEIILNNELVDLNIEVNVNNFQSQKTTLLTEMLNQEQSEVINRINSNIGNSGLLHIDIKDGIITASPDIIGLSRVTRFENLDAKKLGSNLDVIEASSINNEVVNKTYKRVAINDEFIDINEEENSSSIIEKYKMDQFVRIKFNGDEKELNKKISEIGLKGVYLLKIGDNECVLFNSSRKANFLITNNVGKAAIDLGLSFSFDGNGGVKTSCKNHLNKKKAIKEVNTEIKAINKKMKEEIERLRVKAKVENLTSDAVVDAEKKIMSDKVVDILKDGDDFNINANVRGNIRGNPNARGNTFMVYSNEEQQKLVNLSDDYLSRITALANNTIQFNFNNTLSLEFNPKQLLDSMRELISHYVFGTNNSGGSANDRVFDISVTNDAEFTKVLMEAINILRDFGDDLSIKACNIFYITLMMFTGGTLFNSDNNYRTAKVGEEFKKISDLCSLMNIRLIDVKDSRDLSNKINQFFLSHNLNDRNYNSLTPTEMELIDIARELKFVSINMGKVAVKQVSSQQPVKHIKLNSKIYLTEGSRVFLLINGIHRECIIKQFNMSVNGKFEKISFEDLESGKSINGFTNDSIYLKNSNSQELREYKLKTSMFKNSLLAPEGTIGIDDFSKCILETKTHKTNVESLNKKKKKNLDKKNDIERRNRAFNIVYDKMLNQFYTREGRIIGIFGAMTKSLYACLAANLKLSKDSSYKEIYKIISERVKRPVTFLGYKKAIKKMLAELYFGKNSIDQDNQDKFKTSAPIFFQNCEDFRAKKEKILVFTPLAEMYFSAIAMRPFMLSKLFGDKSEEAKDRFVLLAKTNLMNNKSDIYGFYHKQFIRNNTEIELLRKQGGETAERAAKELEAKNKELQKSMEEIGLSETQLLSEDQLPSEDQLLLKGNYQRKLQQRNQQNGRQINMIGGRH